MNEIEGTEEEITEKEKKKQKFYVVKDGKSEEVSEEVFKKELKQQEIKELAGDIQSDNKEIYDIMKTDLYKTLFQVLSRVTLKVEITNLENISSRPIEKIEEKVKSNSSGKKSTTKKVDDFKLENVDVKHRTDNAILLINVDDKVAWIPKVAVKDLNEKDRTCIIAGWFISKIEWNDQKPFNQ